MTQQDREAHAQLPFDGTFEVSVEESKEQVNENSSNGDATSFSALNLCEPTRDAIREMGFTSMTEVQARCIPALLTGKDVLVENTNLKKI